MPSVNNPVTDIWGASPHAARITTEVEPHEVFDLMIRGYRAGASDPGCHLGAELETVLNATLMEFEPVSPEQCPVTELHRQAFASAPGSGVGAARAFKLLLVGFGLGRHDGSGVLSPAVTRRIDELDSAEAAIEPVELVPPERAAIVAELRERQAAPAPVVRDTIPAIPFGVLESESSPVVEGALPFTQSPIV